MTVPAGTPSKKVTIVALPENSGSVTFLLANSVLGAGVLSLSYTFANTGVILGLIVMLAVYFVTVLTFDVLVEAGEMFKVYSFRDLLSRFFGPRMGWVGEFAILATVIGYLTAYVGIVGDYIVTIVKLLVENPSDWMIDKVTVAGIALVLVMLPLSCVKDVRLLASVSMLSVVFVTVLLFSIVAFFFGKIISDDELPVLNWTPPGAEKPLVALYTLTAAFGAQFNALMSYKALNNRSMEKMHGITIRSLLIVLIIYLCVGFAGYASFGPSVADNILNAFDANTVWYITVCRFGMTAVILFSYPLLMFPTRTGLLAVLKPLIDRIRERKDEKNASTRNESPKMTDNQRKPNSSKREKKGKNLDELELTLELDSDESVDISGEDNQPTTDEVENPRSDNDIEIVTSDSSDKSDEISTYSSCSVISESQSEHETQYGKGTENEEEEEEKKMTTNEFIVHIVAAIFLSAIAFGVSAVLPTVSQVFGIFISLFGSFISYICPGMIWWKFKHIQAQNERESGNSDYVLPRKTLIGPALLICGGVLAAILGFWVTIRSM